MNDHVAIRATLGILAVHNLAQNLVLNERGYVTGNLVVSGLLIGIGRASGLSSADMGLRPGDVPGDVRIGVAATAAGVAAGALALSHHRARGLLRDERAVVGSGGEVWRRVALRFPLGTALFEEVAFRGVLPALLRRTQGPIRADTLSAAAFGLWHLIPTGRALSGNPLAQDMATRELSGAIVAGSLAAGASGLAFSWMRQRTGSLLAPWLVHSSFNILSFLAGVIALRLARTTTTPSRP
jgi:hypothetical protein